MAERTKATVLKTVVATDAVVGALAVDLLTPASAAGTDT
jgi:hypothetical protein